LYRHLGQRLGNGCEAAKSRHLFQDFIDATASIEIDKQTICVHFQKRAQNPLLAAAGFDKLDTRIPWLGNRRLQFVFGQAGHQHGVKQSPKTSDLPALRYNKFSRILHRGNPG
jgi:hypothetical protein